MKIFEISIIKRVFNANFWECFHKYLHDKTFPTKDLHENVAASIIPLLLVFFGLVSRNRNAHLNTRRFYYWRSDTRATSFAKVLYVWSINYRHFNTLLQQKGMRTEKQTWKLFTVESEKQSINLFLSLSLFSEKQIEDVEID